VIVDGSPISAGVFDVSHDGRSRLESTQLPVVTGSVTVAVTEEPVEGVPQPAGPMVLVGS
jgi:hypothetical protein